MNYTMKFITMSDFYNKFSTFTCNSALGDGHIGFKKVINGVLELYRFATEGFIDSIKNDMFIKNGAFQYPIVSQNKPYTEHQIGFEEIELADSVYKKLTTILEKANVVENIAEFIDSVTYIIEFDIPDDDLLLMMLK